MPNWCEGNIKIRGKKKNIKEFVENEIVCFVFSNTEKDENGFGKYIEVKPKIDRDKWETTLCYPSDKCHDFYIKNTHRNFFFTSMINIYWHGAEDEDEITICIDDFNSAWNLKEQGWVDHAKKYGIDIRLLGFDQGVQFSQRMTIYRDGRIENEVEQYDDWLWDCPFPNLGG